MERVGSKFLSNDQVRKVRKTMTTETWTPRIGRIRNAKARYELRKGLTPKGALKKHTRKVRGKYKSVCTSAVLAYFGITPDQYRPHDCTSTSVTKILKKNSKISTKSIWKNDIEYPAPVKRVPYAKKRIKQIVRASDRDHTDFYYISCKCARGWHAILVSQMGMSLVDTSPRLRDARMIRSVVRVRVKGSYQYDEDNHQLIL